MFGGIERLLARHDEDRRQAACLEGLSYRRLFDGFRSGADHQPDVGAQYSP
jgi:hypothetical protein